MTTLTTAKGDTGPISGNEKTYFEYNVFDDEVNAEAGTGSKVNGLKIHHTFKGSTGGRHGFYGLLQQVGEISTYSTDRNFVGVQGHVTTNYPTPNASYFGLSGIVQLTANATDTHNITGLEANVEISQGAATKIRTGVQVAARGPVNGTDFDAGISVSNIPSTEGTVAWKDGILFGAQNGAEALDANSNVVSVNSPSEVHSFLNAPNVDFIGHVLAAKDVTLSKNIFSLTGLNAGMNFGRNGEVNTPYIDFNCSGHVNDFDCRFLAAEGQAAAGRGSMFLYAASFTPVVGNISHLGTLGVPWSELHISGNSYLRGFTALGVFAVDHEPSNPVEGACIYSSNGNSGNPCLATYDGTNWRRIAFGSALSAT